MNSFYTEDELAELGLKSYGKNVCLSRKASIYGAENISLGSHVRIDDFCVLSGCISIGNHVHIANFCAIMAGTAGVEMDDFSALSSRSAIYAQSDDYSGAALTNPTVPEKYLNVTYGKVIFGRHVIVGTGSTILPGVKIGEGCSVGSMSLVNRSLAPWGIYVGIPCQYKKERSRKLLEMEQNLLSEEEREG